MSLSVDAKRNLNLSLHCYLGNCCPPTGIVAPVTSSATSSCGLCGCCGSRGGGSGASAIVVVVGAAVVVAKLMVLV